MPLSDTQDVAGPLARTVTDLALMLDATVGPDPDDPITTDGASHVPRSYLDGLIASRLKGARIGVLRTLFGTGPEDDEVGDLVRKALEAMKEQGAIVVDATVPGMDDLLPESSVIGDEFKFDLAAYLAKHPGAPVKSLGEILDRGLNHDALEATFRLRNQPTRRDSEHHRQALVKRRALREAVVSTLEGQKLDVLAYPTLRRKPTLIGEAQIGTTCQLSATTGLPAISMPAGFTVDGLPIGIELLGPAFSEAALLERAYAWEQAASPRRAPFSTPPLVDGAAPGAAMFGFGWGVGGVGGGSVQFRYAPTTAALHYAFSIVGDDSVLAVALHRMDGERVGPIVAHLGARGQRKSEGTVMLRGRDREDFVAGRLGLRVYSGQQPLGGGVTRLTPP